MEMYDSELCIYFNQEKTIWEYAVASKREGEMDWPLWDQEQGARNRLDDICESLRAGGKGELCDNFFIIKRRVRYDKAVIDE